MTLSIRDKKIIWHPFTQEKNAQKIVGIKKAQGSYVYDENDVPYLDLISSWWVNIHGHGHQEIAKSIYDQAKTLEHVLFAGFTHEPAVTLCQELQTILPKNLCRFFFSDNGSTSVEVALKMSYQYWLNLRKKEKKFFLSFDGGYHGDTFGAMSVGAKSGFHNQFKALCFNVLSIPYPYTWNGDEQVELKEEKSIRVLKKYLHQYANTISAIILEPLIQGASGMRICRPQFIKNVVNLVRQYHILVIFDEVMTGFCRTGTYFALHQLEIAPDFLCISKGLTGGFLPLALTVTQNRIYEAFLGDDFKTAFAHGHSYTANPLACSAAITSLKLLKKPECQEAIKTISKMHQVKIIEAKSQCPRIEKIRTLGTIAAFDVKDLQRFMSLAKLRFFEQGMVIRPLKNTIYLMPPYCILEEEIDSVYKKIVKIINTL
ncbi:adenosylmethionine-8-amino-7-oxononanoate aminotransferase [Holospora obtusa F1]|uniref:Adenosylmethionine-8-amino-7-oxononanoate aminotransferase n=1 Tax=Holospora obtusa F1 TaxID=1399147 RepID=W6TEN7_HOLOB|nr:adenosylmethionine--8-amino-7-oxononanoate transaminase [Holospora obtusa]ETZ07326.1 adenosylmethionine-8-amino-7-oxononanoate aminotransferase [Holospora obtusa F1]